MAVYASGRWSPWSEVLHVTPPPGCATHSGTCSGPNQDFDTLVAAGNRDARGIWSDGETMWVADWDDEKLYAYDLFDKDRDAGKDIPLSGGNYPPASQGIWSDGETMWVVNRDPFELMLYAYNLTPGGSFGSRDSTKDITLPNENAAPNGLWSDGQTAWVLDTGDKKIYAYDLTPGSTFGDRDSGQDIALHSDNGNPRAIWSNGGTMWVTDRRRRQAVRLQADTERQLRRPRPRQGHRSEGGECVTLRHLVQRQVHHVGVGRIRRQDFRLQSPAEFLRKGGMERHHDGGE